MQYLLTQQEWDDINRRLNERTEAETKTLQDLCTKVADHMPVDTWRGTKPWQCIHSVKGEWYCDECPVKDVCPEKFKRWSK